MKMRGLGPSLGLFGVQVFCRGKMKWMIEIVMSLTSPDRGLT